MTAARTADSRQTHDDARGRDDLQCSAVAPSPRTSEEHTHKRSLEGMLLQYTKRGGGGEPGATSSAQLRSHSQRVASSERRSGITVAPPPPPPPSATPPATRRNKEAAGGREAPGGAATKPGRNEGGAEFCICVRSLLLQPACRLRIRTTATTTTTTMRIDPRHPQWRPSPRRCNRGGVAVVTEEEAAGSSRLDDENGKAKRPVAVAPVHRIAFARPPSSTCLMLVRPWKIRRRVKLMARSEN